MNEQPTCPSCGKPLVSNNAGPRKRRTFRSKSGRASGGECIGLQRTQGTSNQRRYELGEIVTVSIAFAAGRFEGKARLVRVDSLCVEFDWEGRTKRIYIAESDILPVDVSSTGRKGEI